MLPSDDKRKHFSSTKNTKTLKSNAMGFLTTSLLNNGDYWIPDFLSLFLSFEIRKCVHVIMPKFKIQKLGDLTYLEGTNKLEKDTEKTSGQSEKEATKLKH